MIGGGTIDCGSNSSCPELSGQNCALVEKLDSAGQLVWSFAYKAGPHGSDLTAIRQTRDDGYIAVGSATASSDYPGALIIKLSGAGAVQWQRELGPAGSTWALFNAVQQTSDGGYVATGEFALPGQGVPLTSVLAVKLDSAGNVAWQHGFNDLTGGSPSGGEHPNSILQTADGGYLVGGSRGNATQPGQCCSGALLVKLAPARSSRSSWGAHASVGRSRSSLVEASGVGRARFRPRRARPRAVTVLAAPTRAPPSARAHRSAA